MTGIPRGRRGLAQQAHRQLARAHVRPLGLKLDEALDVRDEMWNVDARLRELIGRLAAKKGSYDVDGVLAQLDIARLALTRADASLLMHQRR